MTEDEIVEQSLCESYRDKTGMSEKYGPEPFVEPDGALGIIFTKLSYSFEFSATLESLLEEEIALGIDDETRRDLNEYRETLMRMVRRIDDALRKKG